MASLKIFQRYKGKVVNEVTFEFISLFLIFFVFSYKKSGIFSLIHLLIFYEFFESASWLNFKTRIDNSFTYLISLESLKLYPGLSKTLFFLAFLYFMFMLIFGQLNISLQMPRSLDLILNFLYLLTIPLFHRILILITIPFRPKNIRDYVPKENDIPQYITDLFFKPIKILKRNNNLKNIVVLVVESLEKGMIHPYNKGYQNILPHLSNYWKNGLRATNTEVKEYIFSAKSLVMTHCALDTFRAYYLYEDLPKPFTINGQKKYYPCVNDYFIKLGYEAKAYYNYPIGIEAIFGNFFKIHGHFKHYKHYHFDKVITDYFQDLESRNSNRPFIHWIYTYETHPPQYWFSIYCQNHEKEIKSYNYNSYKPLSGFGKEMWPSYQCMDLLIKKFTEKLRQSKYVNNTIYLILGDHPLIGFYDNMTEFEPRSAFILFPFEKPGEITNEISLYDVSHTLLEMAGIQDYEPKIPYGKSFFNKTGKSEPIPEKDIEYIQYMFKKYK